MAEVLEDGFRRRTVYRVKEEEVDGRLSVLLERCKEAMEVMESVGLLAGSDALRIVKRFLDE